MQKIKDQARIEGLSYKILISLALSQFATGQLQRVKNFGE